MGGRLFPMPRVSRHQSAPGAMRPGTLYHVTSHAVDKTWLFETARDRVVLLSLPADAVRITKAYLAPRDSIAKGNAKP